MDKWFSKMRIPGYCVGVVCLLILGCQSGDPSIKDDYAGDKPAAINSPVVSQPTLAAGKVIQAGDRVLWVGDDLTQQLAYTRAAATALMSIHPEYHLRFFNGGKDGATVRTSLNWIDDLLGLSRPTVVFVCLGLNDARQDIPPADLKSKYADELGRLVETIKGHAGVREVVVLGPPAVQAGLTPRLDPGSYNAKLLDLGDTAEKVAHAKGADFIDLFIHTSSVYLGQMEMKEPGDPLTLDGRRPTDAGSTVIASVILRGIGVTGEQLDRVAWSPLIPREMRRIRSVLALATRMPSIEPAQVSRELYLSMLRHDEVFFRCWRISPIEARGPSREKLMSDADMAWDGVEAIAQVYVPPAQRPGR